MLSIFEAYALSSQAQDKTSLLINHDVNTMQSDINITTDDETTPVAKRRISNGATTGTIVKAEQHSSNSFNDEAQNMKTADTSVHQLRGRNSRKPESNEISSKAGADASSIGTVTVKGQRKLGNMHDLFNTRIDEWELQDWLLALVLLFVLSIVLRVLGRIHCCGCSALDCLACFFCWEICCDPSPGMNYGVFA